MLTGRPFTVRNLFISILCGACSIFTVFVSGCGSGSSSSPEAQVTFVVIGDYGADGPDELAVANLIKSWNPDFIITTGDNNYEDGKASTIDANIGKYFHEFIYPYRGHYGVGADKNRFFPTMGNHDWNQPDAGPYIDYFTLPGNERYYDFTWGPLHFFALDSDPKEPDGVARDSMQAQWLQERLASSDKTFKFVYTHHPPYSSGYRGSTVYMQWPFTEWGADAFFAGHDHIYERLVIDDMPFFVNGLGGRSIYQINDIVSGSIIRYNGECGAMLVEVYQRSVTFTFYNIRQELIDTHTIFKGE